MTGSGKGYVGPSDVRSKAWGASGVGGSHMWAGEVLQCSFGLALGLAGPFHNPDAPVPYLMTMGTAEIGDIK